MAQPPPGKAIIPQVSKPPLRDPVLMDQPANTNPLSVKEPPMFTESWQRKFLGDFRALGAITGTSTDPAFTYLGVKYRFLPALRLAVPQAALAALAVPNLGAEDTGLLVHVTDFNHVLEWTGTGWDWGPGESGSQLNVQFLNDPMEPWWKLFDGSLGITFLKSDGTLGMQDLPMMDGFYFRR